MKRVWHLVKRMAARMDCQYDQGMTDLVGIVTLPGFNEIDSFVATRMIHSVPDLEIKLIGPAATAVSMAGVEVATPGDWTSLGTCAAAIFGSGAQTFEHIENQPMMDAMRANVSDVRFVGSQCSGAAILHRLGMLDGQEVCTDNLTAPKLRAIGVSVRVDPFHETGRIATAGGCLSSAYLAYWIIDRLAGRESADLALSYVVPIGEEAEYQQRVDRLMPVAAAN